MSLIYWLINLEFITAGTTCQNETIILDPTSILKLLIYNHVLRKREFYFAPFCKLFRCINFKKMICLHKFFYQFKTKFMT